MSDAFFSFAITRDPDRLTALRRYEILDTANESTFDDVARNASVLCGTPIAIINFIDKDRQWFKSEIGIGVKELPLNNSICVHTLLEDEMLIVPDLLLHDSLKNNPQVVDKPHFRFYAGFVIKSEDGQPLGSLCVLDYVPRDLSQAQLLGLKSLTRQVMAELTIRLALKEQREISAALKNMRLENGTIRQTLSLTEQSQDRLIGALEILQDEQKLMSIALEKANETQMRLQAELSEAKASAQNIKDRLHAFVAADFAVKLETATNTLTLKSGPVDEVALTQHELFLASQRLQAFLESL